MLLKTFDKVNSAVRTRYTVYDADGEPLYSFTVDYLAREGVPDNVLKKLDLIKRGAIVKRVTAASIAPGLDVSVILPKEE